MIIFFYVDKDLRVVQNEFGFTYEHKFEKVPEIIDRKVPLHYIYFSTPSDFHNHLEKIKQQLGEQEVEHIHVVDAPTVISDPNFPHHIGFYKSWDKMIGEFSPKIEGKKKIKVAMLNAMSNAIGDHLIGMRAFDYFQEKLRNDLGVDIEYAFYQLNPYRVAPVTKQYSGKYHNIYMLPNRMSRFLESDAFVDLGTLLLRDNFGTQPMIDFFFEAMSIDAATVPDEAKRNKYAVDPESAIQVDQALNVIRSQGRPILLFHKSSTSPIRHLTDARARQMVREIIEKTDYFVVSADGLEYQNPRYMNLKQYSSSLDNFAAIISRVDALIPVDTSTYHLADAFDIPTVVLFTTIEPEYRIKYYPFTEHIMLEEKGGKMYGKHKCDQEKEEAMKEIAYIERKWDGLKVDTILEKLEVAKKNKQEAS